MLVCSDSFSWLRWCDLCRVVRVVVMWCILGCGVWCGDDFGGYCGYVCGC